MKTVKSMYGEREDITILFELDRVLDIRVDGNRLSGDTISLGQISADSFVLLVLDDRGRVELEIRSDNIVRYERVASMAMCSLGGRNGRLEPIECYEIEYYDAPLNGYITNSLHHHLVMFDM